jgi:hypothetical protein
MHSTEFVADQSAGTVKDVPVVRRTAFVATDKDGEYPATDREPAPGRRIIPVGDEG